MAMTRDDAVKLLDTYSYRDDIVAKRRSIYKAVQNDLNQLIDCRGVCSGIPFEVSVTATQILDVFDKKIAAFNKEIVDRGGAP